MRWPAPKIYPVIKRQGKEPTSRPSASESSPFSDLVAGVIDFPSCKQMLRAVGSAERSRCPGLRAERRWMQSRSSTLTRSLATCGPCLGIERQGSSSALLTACLNSTLRLFFFFSGDDSIRCALSSVPLPSDCGVSAVSFRRSEVFLTRLGK